MSFVEGFGGSEGVGVVVEELRIIEQSVSNLCRCDLEVVQKPVGRSLRRREPLASALRLLRSDINLP